MKNNIYYFDKTETVIIADIQGETLYLNDIFSRELVSPIDLIQFIADETMKRVVLGFTPLIEDGFEKNLLQQQDTLFVLKDKSDFLKNNKWMFPVLSHA